MSQILHAGKYELPIGERTLVMGILNITPNSFVDGGKYNQRERALERALQLVAEGADILDIGGESTAPNTTPVSEDEELERIMPVVEMIAGEVDVPLSIDTYKATVAREAIRAGAHMINDIWGAKRDPDMAAAAAELDVPIILMQNRENAVYDALIEDIMEDLQQSIALVEYEGLPREKIILDPGIGLFSKNVPENLLTLKNLHRIVEMGYPVLLGTSRKYFIGEVLNLPVEDRLEGSLATVAYGITKGCHIVRVHDVKETVRVCRMLDAIDRV